MKTLLVSALLAIAALATAQASPPDLDRLNGAINAEAGQEYGSLSTVNGAINIGAGTRADSASTVNGAISVGAQARIGSLSTVNGAIRAQDGVEVGGDAGTVNGSVVFGPGSHIRGDVQTVNGFVELVGTQVDGDVETTNGRLQLGPGTRIAGGVHVNKASRRWLSWGRGSRDPLQVVIAADTEVVGALVFEREVELHVHDSARIGTVEGAEPIRFSGDRP